MEPVKLVLSFTRRYLKALIITVFSMLALVGAQLVIPWVIRQLVDAVTTRLNDPTTLGFINQLTLIVILVFLARAVLQFLRSYMAHIAGWSVVADLRKFVYEHLQRLSLRFYEDKQTGQLMSRVINDTDLFEQLIAHAIPDVFVNLITLIAISVMLFNLNWILALLSLVPIPLVVLSLRLYARYVRPKFVERQRVLGELNAILNDNLSGIREIKAFTREEEEYWKVDNGIESYKNANLKALRLMAIFQPFVEFTSSLGMLVVIYFGGRLAFRQILPVADLVAFFLYLEMFYQPVRNLSGAWEAVQNALAGAERIAGLLKEEPELEKREEAIALTGKAQGHIRFNNVSFEYIPGEPVLENINLDIPPKKVVALVGPTGVGKSTLASLIPRFYDVTSGSITLDGHDIRDLTLESLRRQISIVLQDVFLFHGTVRENILFGRPNATEGEMIEAAKIANAHDFIMNLPDGYDTMIGERGVKLSGGQKQRLSIARAVLKDAPILILDEATSAVDTETELLIQQALDRLIAGRTTIIIAHRLSTIRNADQIVVLEGKHIVEQGTHEELFAHRGLYYRLCTIQQKLEPVSLN
ncbi:ABC-type multidrug transport system, ATPase and permease components [Anaerolinea thermolimosa]|uniref:ABC transporter ATP-binding protein n=1 Tax=Anaerolinea thermolimosa TaxID=229919 RepID=UPI0007848059|nr:ABC transporter ATP-binding protein [Anaerolinea thermolimosa]GAP07299.1 ABC-type multidrug transport system, ATPase and permease components [Anaerolinea thermolimosa]